MWAESRRLTVTRHAVGLGLRVAHLSDLHLDRTGIGPERIAAALAQIRPSLVVMTGDYFDRRYREDELVRLLRLLEGYPLLSVLGNHDYRLPPGPRQALVRLLAERAGLLRNELTTVGPLRVFGMDDPVTRHAATSCPPCDLLLVHTPDLPVPRDRLPVRLILSGHYHGGQVRILPPKLLAALVLRRDPLARQGHLEGFMPGRPPTYVSRGLGMSLLPVRWNSPPEIAVFD